MSENAQTPTMDSERLIAACVLSVVGGFLDIYTYLFRGNVFANAVTGNMVLFGFHLANGKWEMCGRYLLAIVSYAFGIFMANLIHARLPGSRRITWNQFVILVELVCLLPVCFIPYGRWDFLVNSGIAFVCALQVQTFRRVHGLPFASTMCTGNLRSGTDALYHGAMTHDRTLLRRGGCYFGVIGCFLAGAALGGVVTSRFSQHAVLAAVLFQGAAFILMWDRRSGLED